MGRRDVTDVGATDGPSVPDDRAVDAGAGWQRSIPRIARLGRGEWSLMIPAGTLPSELVLLASALPDDVRFTEANGDVDVVLIFGGAEQVAGGAPSGAAERRRRLFRSETEQRAYRLGRADTIVAIHRALAPVMTSRDPEPPPYE